MKTAALKFFDTNLTFRLNYGIQTRDAAERLLESGDGDHLSIATYLLWGPLGTAAVECFKNHAIATGAASYSILFDPEATGQICEAFSMYVLQLCREIGQKQTVTL